MGYNIPHEVIDLTIDYIAPPKYFDNHLTGRRVPILDFTHRELATCSLVCYAWAVRCRYFIFGDIKLRTAQDLEDLISLIRAPGSLPPLSDCLHAIEILVADPSTPPWLHRVYTCGHFGRCVFMISLGHGSQSHWDGKNADFQRSLPRRLPQSLFGGVNNLRIHNCAFDDPQDLLHLFRTLTHTYDTRLFDLKFGERVTMPSGAWMRKIVQIAVRGSRCTGVSSLIETLRLVFCQKMHAQGKLTFAVWDGVIGVVRKLLRPLESKGVEMSLGVTVDAAFTLTYQSVFVATMQRINETPNVLIGLRFIERAPYAPELLQECNWDEFEEALATLGASTRVGIKTGSPARFAWLIERIAVSVSLAAMHTRGHMRAALHSEEDGLGNVVLHSEEVFAASLEHSVDGTIVHLSRTQWIKMQLRRRESEKFAFLRDVASGKEVDVEVEMETMRNMFENVCVSDKIPSAAEVICLT